MKNIYFYLLQINCRNLFHHRVNNICKDVINVYIINTYSYTCFYIFCYNFNYLAMTINFCEYNKY